ncbi:MAG TPA: hypothetical protein VKA04_06475 [Pseudodesulfovibrio sp.]|nr:hypothetical protein [Pseudodesulfovibrio sp.]
MKTILLGLLILASGAALAAPPMAANHEERSIHMLKGMPTGPVGRYQLVRLMKGDEDHAAVMVLDTANGHLWEWRQGPGAKGTASKGQIIYLGHVEPGTTPGQVVERYTVPAR